MTNDKRRRAVEDISDEEEAAIQAGIAADPDNPEWTDEELRNARPFREVFPEFVAAIERDRIERARGRPPLDAPKRQVTLRIDAEVVDRFKAEGRGWQSRINTALRKAVGL